MWEMRCFSSLFIYPYWLIFYLYQINLFPAIPSIIMSTNIRYGILQNIRITNQRTQLHKISKLANKRRWQIQKHHFQYSNIAKGSYTEITIKERYEHWIITHNTHTYHFRRYIFLRLNMMFDRHPDCMHVGKNIF